MDWLLLLSNQNQIQAVLDTNSFSEEFGLQLSQEDAQLIISGRKSSLMEQRRVEFGKGIITSIICEFCDSDFINQNNYVDTLIRLQDIFFLYKNEMLDEITDDELLHLMKDMFENVCYGDLDYLEGTCLADFATAVRSGYQDFISTEGYGEASRFSKVPQWNYSLFLEKLKELENE